METAIIEVVLEQSNPQRRSDEEIITFKGIYILLLIARIVTLLYFGA